MISKIIDKIWKWAVIKPREFSYTVNVNPNEVVNELHPFLEQHKAISLAFLDWNTKASDLPMLLNDVYTKFITVDVHLEPKHFLKEISFWTMTVKFIIVQEMPDSKAKQKVMFEKQAIITVLSGQTRVINYEIDKFVNGTNELNSYIDGEMRSKGTIERVINTMLSNDPSAKTLKLIGDNNVNTTSNY